MEENDVYIGGLDGDGHERKDNYAVQQTEISFYLSDGYLMRHESENGNFPVTNEQAAEEMESLIQKALNDRDMLIRITDTEGNISFLDRSVFTIPEKEMPPDSDNKRIYGARAKVWNNKARKYKNFVETVENRQKYDIIKSKKEREIKISMNINNIELPIEQRNTGKGNPNAVLMFGVELNNRQKKLLEQLSDFDSKVIVPKKSVKMSNLAALTAYTGDEFAMFTNGNERLIIRGNQRGVNVDVTNGTTGI